jgi:hypothetical protein
VTAATSDSSNLVSHQHQPTTGDDAAMLSSLQINKPQLTWGQHTLTKSNSLWQASLTQHSSALQKGSCRVMAVSLAAGLLLRPKASQSKGTLGVRSCESLQVSPLLELDSTWIVQQTTIVGYEEQVRSSRFRCEGSAAEQ